MFQSCLDGFELDQVLRTQSSGYKASSSNTQRRAAGGVRIHGTCIFVSPALLHLISVRKSCQRYKTDTMHAPMLLT